MRDKDREKGWETTKKFIKIKTTSSSSLNNINTDTADLYDPLTPIGKVENTQPTEQVPTDATTGQQLKPLPIFLTSEDIKSTSGKLISTGINKSTSLSD